MRIFLTLAPVALFAACLSPTNPFDPNAPAELQAKSSVRATVVDGDEGIEGATVTLTPEFGDVVDADTDEDGVFSFRSLIPGRISIAIEHPTHFAVTQERDLLPGEDRELGKIRMVAIPSGEAGVLQGVAQKEEQLVLPSAQQDHAGIRVEVQGAGVVTFTDEQGNYALAVQPGTYDLDFVLADHERANADGVVVAQGESTTVSPVVLAIAPGSISGTVLLEGEDPDVGDHSGVTVVAGGASTLTAQDGSFQLVNVVPGTLTLRASKGDSYAALDKTVVVQSGVETTLTDVLLLPLARGSVVGRVKVGTSGLEGALVSLTGTASAALTSSDGSFALTGVAIGSYELTASKAGFSRAVRGGVVVSANAATDVGELFVISAQGDFDINDGAAYANDPLVTLSLDSDDAVLMRISEDPGFGDVPTPVAFDNAPTFTLSDGDGEKTLFVELTNASSDVTLLSAQIFLDETAPVIDEVVLDGGALFTNSLDGDVRVATDATEDGSGLESIQLSADDVLNEPFFAFQSPKTFSLSPNSDGLRDVYVVVRDRAGNSSTPFHATITRDTEPPTAIITLNDDAVATSSSEVDVTISVPVGSEDIADIAFSTNSGFPVTSFQPFQSPFAVTLASGEGTRELFVKVRDLAGNVSTDTITDDIIVDKTAPAGVFVVVGGGVDATNASSASLTVGGSGFSSVRVFVDGVAATSGFVASAPSTVSLGAEGLHTISVDFADDAGNIASAQDAITRDVTAPSGTVSINSGDAFTNDRIVALSITATGATQMAVAIDGTVDTESFQPLALTSTAILPNQDCSALGCRSVCVKFKDDAGNVSSQTCDTITLDRVAPSTPIFVEDDQVTSEGTITFHVVAQPDDAFFNPLGTDGSQYEVLDEALQNDQADFARIVPDSAAVTNVPFTFELFTPSTADSLLAAEVNVLRLRARDAAGNVSPEASIVFVVDDVAPAAPTLAPTPTVRSTETVSINFAGTLNTAASDATFDHYRIATTLLGGANNAFDTTQEDGIVITLLPNALNTITVTAVDAAGNESDPTTVTVCADTLAPSRPTIVPGSAIARGKNVEISVDLSADAAPRDVAVCTPQNGDVIPAASFEVKDGTGLGFSPANESDPGVFLVEIRRNEDTEVCVRAVDEAGNRSDEDCSVIAEVSDQQIVSSASSPRAHDSFGDAVVFLGPQDALELRDISGVEAPTILTGAPSLEGGNGVEPDLTVTGDPSRLWIAYTGRVANVTSAVIVQVNRAVLPPVIEAIFAFPGISPGIDGDDVVYWTEDEVPRGFYHTTLSNPSVRTLISEAGVKPCNRSRPVVSEGLVVWCEGSEGDRIVLSTVNGSQQRVLTTSPAQTGFAFFDGQFGIEVPQQPLLDSTFAAFAEDVGGTPMLRFVETPGDFGAPIVETDAVVDQIVDVSGGFLVGLNVRATISNDIVLYDLQHPDGGLTKLTDDVVPQSDVSIDGLRVTYKDQAGGEALRARELSNLRWLTPTKELGIVPATSSTATAWAQSEGNLLVLKGVVLPSDDPSHFTQTVDAPSRPVFFDGPPHYDPTFAVGGTRVAYLSPGTSNDPTVKQLFIVDLASNEAAFIDGGAVPLRPTSMTLNPEGTQLVLSHVELNGTGTLARISLPANLPGTRTSPGAISLGAPNKVATGSFSPIVDVDGAITVFMDGGDPDSRQDTRALRCLESTVVRTIPTPTAGREPKVASIGGVNVLVYLDVSSNARACQLQCDPVPQCTNNIDIGGVGAEAQIQVSRDFFASFTSSEPEFDQIVLVNLRSGSRTFVTTNEYSHNAVSMAEGRMVWTDALLGKLDIFEMFVR